MRWFHSNRLIGGGAALAALLLQLALSFAHLHPQDLFRRLPGGAVSIAVYGGSDHRQAAPALQRESKAPPEVYCDICASINLVGSSQDSAVPGLPSPEFLGTSRLALSNSPAPPARRHLLFQSRAPPTA